MRVFLYKTLLYASPLLVIFGITEWYLSHTDDNLMIDEVIERQQKEPETRFIRGYVPLDMNTYKWKYIEQKAPEILILGSSRVMQFRDFHFSPYQAITYNGGGLLQSAHDVIALQNIFANELLPRPKLLLIGLDPWWFKQKWHRTDTWLSEGKLVDHASEYTYRLNVMQDLVRSGFKNFRSQFDYPRNIGALAQYNNSGFRYDGSMALSDKLLFDFENNPHYTDRGDVSRHIIDGTSNRFIESEPDTLLFENVKSSLIRLKELGIQLIIYFPPFSSQSLNLLNETKKHSAWWAFYSKHMLHSLSKEFDHIIPIEHPVDYEKTDIFFEDGIHPSEVFVGFQCQKYFAKWPFNGFTFDLEHLDSLSRQYSLPLSYQSPTK